MKLSSTIFALLVITAFATVALAAEQQQCVMMSDVSTLALENTKTTTRLRTGNVPKIQCVGNCPSDAAVSNVHCVRQGMDDMGNPTWRCVPEFAVSSQVTKRVYGLNNVRVQCEGCTKRGDPMVTAGSCVVQYGISELGRISSRHRGGGHRQDQEGDIVGFIFFTVFALALLYIIVKGCRSSSRQRRDAEEGAYSGVYPGIPLDAKGNPIHHGHQPMQQTVHHHHGGGGGFGGGGFGTGMLTGFLVGDAISHMGHHHDGGYGGGYDDGGGFSGGGGFGDGGGFGGTDFV